MCAKCSKYPTLIQKLFPINTLPEHASTNRNLCSSTSDHFNVPLTISFSYTPQSNHHESSIIIITFNHAYIFYTTLHCSLLMLLADASQMHLRFSCQACPHYPPLFIPLSFFPFFPLRFLPPQLDPHNLPSRWRTIQKGMNQSGERESNGEHKHNQREKSRLREKYTSIEEKTKKKRNSYSLKPYGNPPGVTASNAKINRC